MPEEYYKTKATVDEYIRLAKDINGAELIEKLKDYLPINSLILEIGSGPGSDWQILNKTYQVIGSDYSNEFLYRLQASYPAGSFLELDAVTLRTEEKYDGLYSNKVMHHLNNTELENSIKRQHDILNHEGIICHSFWKGEGSEIFKGLFVNYHSKKSLNEFFSKYFDTLLLYDYTEFEEGDSILLIGKKK